MISQSEVHTTAVTVHDAKPPAVTRSVSDPRPALSFALKSSTNNTTKSTMPPSTVHCLAAFQRMSDMYRERKLCDVILSCNNNQLEIHAHRVILSSISDYFEAMFTNDLAEAHKTRIEINELDGEALRTLVNFIYTGRIELNEQNVLRVLTAANFLQLNSVVQCSCEFLVESINSSNCLSISRFGEEHSLQPLSAMARRYIVDHFEEFAENSDLLDELTETELSDLLADDNLHVASEEQVFTALMRWINLSASTRCGSLSRLLALVKLPLLTTAFLTSQIETNELLADRDAQRLMLEAAVYHMTPSRFSSSPSGRTLPRKSTMGVLLCVGGIDSTAKPVSYNPCFIEKYDCRSGCWTPLRFMTPATAVGSNGSLTTSLCSLASSNNVIATSQIAKRLQFGAAVFQSKLYVVGGRDGLKTLNFLECFDIERECWVTLPAMSTHRHGLQAAFLGNEPVLYAVGGHDGWSFLNSVERYDVEGRVWCNVASMASARSTLGVAVVDNLLYAVGGRDVAACLDSVECYSPLMNKWSACSPMNKRRGAVAITALNGFIYAIGGHEVPNAVASMNRYDCGERYDPRVDQWTMIAHISRGREAIGVSSLGSSYIYIVGGYDGHKLHHESERYDPVLNEWSKVHSLNYPRVGACLVHVPNVPPE